MSVPVATAPSVAIACPTQSLLRIRTDPYSGRKYHASTALPENTDLLGPCLPYSYTIYKRFRNEVCAECWRYDRGRRSFLTRRDDEGFQHENLAGGDGNTPSSSDGLVQKDANMNSVGAGLWFCDAECQRYWIIREGINAVDHLRRLEGARQKKTPLKQDAQQEQVTESPNTQIAQEALDRAWNAVRERERSPKEVRKWGEQLRLDDYETDMARYVLLALLHYHRERSRTGSSEPESPPRYESTGEELQKQTWAEASEGEGRAEWEKAKESWGYEEGSGSDWRTFASLQRNELALIRACPEILEHQTRIYQLLKGRFGSDAAFASSRSVNRPCASRSSTAASSPNGMHSAGTPTSDGAPRSNARSVAVNVNGVDRNGRNELKLEDIITIENVRTILGVDPGNSFGIWEEPIMEESEGLGFALYPVASLFNHHCSPNVRNRNRLGRKMRFLTTKAVEEGDELCISYIGVDGLADVNERQKALLEGWYFNCRCGRCTDPEAEVCPW